MSSVQQLLPWRRQSNSFQWASFSQVTWSRAISCSEAEGALCEETWKDKSWAGGQHQSAPHHRHPRGWVLSTSEYSLYLLVQSPRLPANVLYRNVAGRWSTISLWVVLNVCTLRVSHHHQKQLVLAYDNWRRAEPTFHREAKTYTHQEGIYGLHF